MDVNAIPAAALPQVDPQVPAALRARRGEGNDPAKAKKVAQEFEAMFVGMMLKSMRDTVGKDKLTGGGHGEETFRSLLDQEYATAAAKGGGVGLAAMIEKELTRNGSAGPPALKGSGHAD
jgi:peptidoglycan hydrolase FlgJ